MKNQLQMSVSVTSSPKPLAAASEADIDRALVLLFALPSREPEDDASRKILRSVFREAMTDAPAIGLGQALQAIARGTLGHAYRPSPPELRILIDKITAPAKAAERREAIEAEDQPIVGGDFPATYADIDKQLDRIARTMTKPKGYDIEEVREEYYRALRGIKLKVLVETVDRILDGRITRKFLTVPRVNELAALVREVRDESEKASIRTARVNGMMYRYKLPKTKVLMERVFKDEMRGLVDNDVLPRGAIWLPGPVNDHPEIGTAYAPDPEWQPAVPA